MNRRLSNLAASLLVCLAWAFATGDEKKVATLEEDWRVLLNRKSWTQDRKSGETKTTVQLKFASTTENATSGSATRKSGRTVLVDTRVLVTGPKPTQTELAIRYRLSLKEDGKQRLLEFASDVLGPGPFVCTYRLEGGKLVLTPLPKEGKETSRFLVGEFQSQEK